jgi:hypothetical protein
MANLNFNSDLKLGNEGEQIIIDFLTTKGCELVNTNNDNEYDIKMAKDGVITSYEIKTDFFCAPLFDSGNLFVEFSSRNKPSGISVTKSDWFVTYFMFLNEAWFIKSSTLRGLIETNELPIFKNAGDINSNTQGYLLNRKKFKKYFNVFKI